jgi:lipid-binding SYLF domain-containing protein
MLEAAIHEEAEAALNRLQVKHSDLKAKLNKAYGYAVFPSVGRAGVVLGGAYGEGEVYENGQPVGFATMGQITIGVQVGGQTFTEIVIFNNKQVLDNFKHRGKIGFTANASAVLVKAAATATSSTSGLEAKAYSLGGMLLELSLGGSSFLFVPPLIKPAEKKDSKQTSDEYNNREKSEEENQSETPLSHKQEQDQESVSATTKGKGEQHSNSDPQSGVLTKIGKLPVLGQLISSSVQKFSHSLGDGKSSPLQKVGKLLSGVNKERSLNRTLHKDVQAALKMIEEDHPKVQKIIDQAYGYAVFPAVGRASAVLGGSYGKGEVFEQKRLVGYAGIVQVTLGVQLGGETFTEIVLFSDKEDLKRFKQSKTGFAANASAVILKAGAAVSNSYQSDRVLTFSEGGLLIEAVIGVQKFIFKPAALTRGKSLEDENEEKAKAA